MASGKERLRREGEVKSSAGHDASEQGQGVVSLRRLAQTVVGRQIINVNEVKQQQQQLDLAVAAYLDLGP